MTANFIASDGVKCTDANVLARYEEELRRKKAADEHYERCVATFETNLAYLMAAKRITPKYVRLFYQNWSLCAGYANQLGDMRNLIAGAKDRIIDAVLRRAKRHGWKVWRRDWVLYVETPYGQCSWHVMNPHYNRWHPPSTEFLKWFEAFPERKKGKWSEKRNTDRIVRRLLGEQIDVE